MKPRIRCTLISFELVGPQGMFSSEFNYVAHVRMHERHPRLGGAGGGITRTSLILVIDFTKQEVETLNSIYTWI